MSVYELRMNAVILLIFALEAIEFGQFAAAERLSASAAQYDSKADAIEALSDLRPTLSADVSPKIH